jgi:hypothetical protein
LTAAQIDRTHPFDHKSRNITINAGKTYYYIISIRPVLSNFHFVGKKFLIVGTTNTLQSSIDLTNIFFDLVGLGLIKNGKDQTLDLTKPSI